MRPGPAAASRNKATGDGSPSGGAGPSLADQIASVYPHRIWMRMLTRSSSLTVNLMDERLRDYIQDSIRDAIYEYAETTPWPGDGKTP